MGWLDGFRKPAPTEKVEDIMAGFTEQMTAQLRGDEGEKLYAYQDHLGFWTIGVGRLIDQRKGGGLTKAESAYLLANDIERKRAEVLQRLPWAARLDAARFGVLLNMAFQMGIDGLCGFVRTLELVKAEQYDIAAINMMRSTWAAQTPERAQRMSDQMKTGVWQIVK